MDFSSFCCYNSLKPSFSIQSIHYIIDIGHALILNLQLAPIPANFKNVSINDATSLKFQLTNQCILSYQQSQVMSQSRYNVEQLKRQLEPSGYQALKQLIEESLIDEIQHLGKSNDSESQRRQQISHMDDLSIYRCILINEQPKDEESQEQQYKDDELRKKIDQYNRVTKGGKDKEKEKEREKRSRRNANEREEGRKRKVRTTITQSKLDQMNRIFSQYIETKSKNKEDDLEQSELKSDGNDKQDANSLKSIGERLGLGYSTILHKFRQFRATRKVKGGALIAATQKKRKYKKSKDIQQLIHKSLQEQKFFTAVQLSRYISQKYNKILSRSIISRHLGEMGYSYKNIKSNPVNKNTEGIKAVRKEYVDVYLISKNVNKIQIFFIHQRTFTLNNYVKKQQKLEQKQDLEFEWQTSVMLFGNSHGLLKDQSKSESFDSVDFQRFLLDSIQIINQHGPSQNQKAIVLDMKDIHQGGRIAQLRLRLRQSNVMLFYMPPHSEQFNLLTFLFDKISNDIKNQQYENNEQRRQVLDQAIKSYYNADLSSFENEVGVYALKASRQQNF